MENNSWRDIAIKTLKSALKENRDVLSLSLFGSLAKPGIKKDRWSDIDALLIVQDTALTKFFSDY